MARALSEAQSRFLDWWLCDEREREPPTQGAYAAANGVSETTLRRWRNDPVFRREWSERVTATVGSPERVQTIMDTLYASAAGDGDVTAAKQYLAYLDKVSPPPVADEAAALDELSTAELAVLAADLGLRCPRCSATMSEPEQEESHGRGREAV